MGMNHTSRVVEFARAWDASQGACDWLIRKRRNGCGPRNIAALYLLHNNTQALFW